MRATHPLILMCFASLIFFGLVLSEPSSPLAQTPIQTQRIPTFSQCQALASPKTPPAERTAITQIFKSNNLFCSMATPPFPVLAVLTSGQSKSQLRLVMGKHGRYELDGKSLLDVLLPDRASIPPAQMLMLAGQVVGMLGQMFSSDIDAHSVIHAGGKAKALAGVLGVNARAALQQVALLRGHARLNEADIEPSFWLNHLSRIEPPPLNAAPLLNAPAQNAGPMPTGPAWMQKLMGAGQNLLGTFHGGGE